MTPLAVEYGVVVPVSAGFKEHVAELLEPLGGLAFKRFFGGLGLYVRNKMIGFIMRDRVFLKVGDQTKRDFELEGAKPFTFTNGKGEVVSIAYYEVPARVLDDPDEMLRWARRASEVAMTPRTKAVRKSSLRDLPLVSPRKSTSRKPVKRR